MSDRKLARIVRVDDIKPIEGADAIELAIVGGWQVVVKKNQFLKDSLAIYFEIDSFLPEGEPAWQFLIDKQSKFYEGKTGHVLRTIKLRGEYSQGLLLPFTGENVCEKVKEWTIEQLFNDSMSEHVKEHGSFEGADLTDVLGILKYEPPLSAELSGVARCNFPSMFSKSDQERIQNLRGKFMDYWVKQFIEYEVTEKLEGSSMSIIKIGEEFHVCSRNLSLDRGDSSFWKVAIRDDMERKINEMSKELEQENLCIQGELIGPSIQGNIYNLKDHMFMVYNIQIPGQFCDPNTRRGLCEKFGFQHVPVLHENFAFPESATVSDVLKMAEGKTLLGSGVQREGLVFKAVYRQLQFKAISNLYLAKQKDE